MDQKTTVAGTLTVGGIEYVVIPKVEYLRFRDALIPADTAVSSSSTVDAHTFTRQSIARDLRAAREHAGLTQAELAQRMAKSQTLVSQTESGDARVSERYVAAVLKACKLPADWASPNRKNTKRAGKR